MRSIFLLPPLLALTAAVAPAATPAPKPAPAPSPSPGEIVAAAPVGDWIDIAPDDLLVMTLAPDARGQPRRIVIQLMPPPFNQGWIANIRMLAKAHWYDGTAVTRVQDNYVTQWGDSDGEDKAKAKKLPAGLSMVPESEYVSVSTMHPVCDRDVCPQAPEPVETTLQAVSRDSYAPNIGFGSGWPLAFDDNGAAWPIHCYGMVGVGRNLSPDTGTGAELYTVIGHAPRHLDRNIALVGRVIEGMAHLSSLPRGTGPLGVYETPEERVPVRSIRLASELPPAEQPRVQYLSTQSESFAHYADARANRRDPFFIVPAGGADICNIPVPIRPKP